MARGRTPKAPKVATVVVVTETTAPFVPPPVLVPPQVFQPRAIYRCPHCGSANAKRDGGSPVALVSFECQRCGTCPNCERPGAPPKGGAFECQHCATRNGRLTVFPVVRAQAAPNGSKTHRTKFKIPAARPT